MRDFTIGILAKESGVGVETVRFYERKGLIKKPIKKATGFRQYSPEDALKIKFIKRAQELGFTLKETKELMGLRVRSNATCDQVKIRTDKKLEEIDSKIADLMKMKSTLQKLSNTCLKKNASTKECPILGSFAEGYENG